MFSELNHRMFVRSGEDFLLTPEIDKFADAANWMMKAWRKCFELYATPNKTCSELTDTSEKLASLAQPATANANRCPLPPTIPVE